MLNLNIEFEIIGWIVFVYYTRFCTFISPHGELVRMWDVRNKNKSHKLKIEFRDEVFIFIKYFAKSVLLYQRGYRGKTLLGRGLGSNENTEGTENMCVRTRGKNILYKHRYGGTTGSLYIYIYTDRPSYIILVEQ